MFYFNKLYHNSPLIALALLLFCILAIVALVTLIIRYFCLFNLAKLDEDKILLNKNIIRFKSFIENNTIIQAFIHGYTSGGISSYAKILTNFEKTLTGKFLRFFGSLSILITITLRSKIDVSGTFIAYIPDDNLVLTAIAVFASFYSTYLLIFYLCKLKVSMTYLLKGNWIKRNSPR